jgi:hypothetical protein
LLVTIATKSAFNCAALEVQPAEGSSI